MDNNKAFGYELLFDFGSTRLDIASLNKRSGSGKNKQQVDKEPFVNM
jgi:hypothetical protein